jgi:hypothetical protein
MVSQRNRALLIALVLGSALRAADAVSFQVHIEVRDSKGRPFADPSQTLCRQWYPKIHAALFGEGYPLPFPEIKVILESSLAEGIWPFRPVVPAYTDGNVIHVNSAYVSEVHQSDPNDYAGMLIHELTHVDQHYANGAGPDWLVEGIAEYMRHKYLEQDIEPRLHLNANGNLQGFELERSKSDFATRGYQAGYTVAGAFLFWLEVRKDKDVVPTLNRTLREGRYSATIFQQRCGAPLEALWSDFVEQSRSSR